MPGYSIINFYLTEFRRSGIWDLTDLLKFERLDKFLDYRPGKRKNTLNFSVTLSAGIHTCRCSV